MAKTKKIDPPTMEQEAELDGVIENGKEVIKLGKKQYAIGWLKNGTKRKITHILHAEADDDKVTSKCAAALLLNGFWSIKFFYWAVWRWFYYVRQYDDEAYINVFALAKKKVPLESYVISTILLTEIRDTMMTMKRAEVEHFRQENFGGKRGTAQKNTTT